MKKRVLLFGGGGRVGAQIVAELLRRGMDMAVVDIIEEAVLSQKVARIANDSRLALDQSGGYPVSIGAGTIELDLPEEWDAAVAEEAMRQAHRREGLERIDTDGTV